jgi:hypothetical protein
MNARTTLLALAAGISVALTLGAIQPAQAAPVVAVVSGGGTAIFDDPRFAEGGLVGTQFGMGVTVQSDGSAKGHFECIIKGVLALSMTATSGYCANGSVTFSGPAIVHFAGGGTVSFTAGVTATAGGPEVGTFCLSPPTFADTECDHETVVDGRITINKP